MPLNTKIGGQTRYIKDKAAICLTDNQARHVYKKVESGSIINIDTIKQEIEQDIDKIDDTSGKINPYCNIIVNKAEEEIIYKEERQILELVFGDTQEKLKGEYLDIYDRIETEVYKHY